MNYLKRLFFISILILSSNSFCQTLTFDEFLETGKDFLNQDALLEIRELLPKEFYITAEDIGDFSGDGKNDFAIAVMPKNKRGKNIYIYMFCDSLDKYEIIFSDTLKYFELPIEVGFSISNNVCFITQKLKDRSWEIMGYSFYKNEFSTYDSYKTTLVSVSKKSEVGREDYFNYSNLLCFDGYFDLNSIEQYQKSKYIFFPVYNFKRNLYKNYKHKFTIDDGWKWTDPKNYTYDEYGTIQVSTSGKNLLLILNLNEYFYRRIDKESLNTAEFYFDLSGEKLIGSKTANIIKRQPKFRTTSDENIGRIKIDFDFKQKNNQLLLQFGESYNYDEIKKIKVNRQNNTYQVSVPLNIFNTKITEEINNFFRFYFTLNDGTTVELKSSDGSADNPSSYGKMRIIQDGEYLGTIKNRKFGDLINKFNKNGLKTTNLLLFN